MAKQQLCPTRIGVVCGCARFDGLRLDWLDKVIPASSLWALMSGDEMFAFNPLTAMVILPEQLPDPTIRCRLEMPPRQR
jgi:hypothetical protein